MVAGACGAGSVAAGLQRGAAALGAGRPRARLAQRAAVLACVKAATRRLRRWPSASLDPGCARTAWESMAGTEKRRLTEQRNTDTMGVAETANSTSEWRKEGAHVRSSIGRTACWNKQRASNMPVATYSNLTK